MEKKILNLNFVELAHQPGNTDVCLMPCPCSASDSYYPPPTTEGASGGNPCWAAFGYIAGKMVDGYLSGNVASVACWGGKCSSDADFAGINSEASGGGGGGGGGSK
ncbi:MAG: hypothetical protein WC836_17110 [Desulfobacula sp.]|jgi:hypothetical protein